MDTLLLNNSNNDIARAASILQNCGLVAFPTETVYGLGGNALCENAVRNIFAAKGRPNDNPLIVHISDVDQLADIVKYIPPKAQLLIDEFWPGPLTIVMPRKDTISDFVTAGLDSVAVRMPNHIVALQLIAKAGLPIAAPSANSSGKPSPTSAKHVMDDLNGRIDAVIDGGSCSVGVESTVIDMTGDIPLLLRPGGITYEQLVGVLGEVKKNYEYKEGEIPKSPGVKYKHYAPNAEVYIVRGDLPRYTREIADKYSKIGVLTKKKVEFPSNCIVKYLGDMPSDYAANLFAFLREFNDDKVDIIIADDIDEAGINLAVHNRLYKAAGYKVITI